MSYCSKSSEIFKYFFTFLAKNFDAARKNKHTKLGSLQRYWPTAKQYHQVFVEYSHRDVHQMFSRITNFQEFFNGIVAQTFQKLKDS